MLLPEEAFLQCLYLLPEARHSDAAVVQLKSLMEMLQTGRFARVWTLLGSKDLRVKLDAVAGFDDSIRECEAKDDQGTDITAPVPPDRAGSVARGHSPRPVPPPPARRRCHRS